jgi:hypothetical protein
MGKYDDYKMLTLPLSVVKKFFTTTVKSGRLAVGASGNEGIILAEWIQERIDDGTIDPNSTPISGTDLTNIPSSTTVTVLSSTGLDTILPAATTLLAGVMTTQDKIDLAASIAIVGVGGDTNLGIFTGTIISDNSTIKDALQELENQLGTIPSVTLGTISSLSPALTVINGINAVVGTGVDLTFDSTLLNLSNIGGDLNLTQIDSSGAILNSIIIFDGTNWVISSIPVAAHNSLSGLQGGVPTEYYHLDQEVYDTIYNLSAGELLGQASYLGAPQLQAITLGGSTIMNLTTGVISLVNDLVTPGNNKFYGTNGFGVKAWYSFPAFGTVTNLSATNSTDLTFTVTNPTTTPNITAILTNTGVTAATYGDASNIPIITVNAKGRITTATSTAVSITSSNITNFSEAVDDRLSSLLVAGAGITLTYDDPGNTLTIATTGGGLTGTGITNRVAYWTSTTNLGNNANFTFDGTNVTIGSAAATSARLTTRGTGGTTATYGIIHQNSTNVDVLKVTDKGSLYIGALNELDIHPDYFNIATGGTYPINVAGGNLSLYSDLTVLVEGGSSASNTPSFKSIATRSTNIGNCINAQIEGVFAMSAGSNRYSDLLISTNVNQTAGTSAIRSVYVNPVLTAATNYVGIEVNAPGHTALRTSAGKVRFDLGSDATGDLFYRDASGNLVRLPVGGPMEVLGSTGTVPAWTTTAGSLPGGSNGDFLVYAGGTWVSASPIKDKQTGITGTSVTLGATPLASTLFLLYRNGVLMDDPEDYTIVGNVVSITPALVSTERVLAIYYI